MSDEAKKGVEEELEGLSEKVGKLASFLSGNKIEKAGVSEAMRNLMAYQLNAMRRYAQLLQERLKIWGKSDEELRTDIDEEK